MKRNLYVESHAVRLCLRERLRYFRMLGSLRVRDIRMSSHAELTKQVEALKLELEQAYGRIRSLHRELRAAKAVQAVPASVSITNTTKNEDTFQ